MAQITISEELLNHYEEVKEYKDSLLNNNTIAKHSDIASSLNTVTRVLVEASKALEKAHNAENFASMQQTLIATLKDTDEEVCERFIKALKEKQL